MLNNKQRCAVARSVTRVLQNKSNRTEPEQNSYIDACNFLGRPIHWWDGADWEEIKAYVMGVVEDRGYVTACDIKEQCEATMEVTRTWLERLEKENTLRVTRYKNPNYWEYTRS